MPKAKMVFIAHPMSGDVEGNTQKVVDICRKIHTAKLIPVFPSFTWRKYLGYTAKDNELATGVNEAYFRSGFIDELWLYGDRLTEGMKKEVRLAIECGIRIVPKTREISRQLLREPSLNEV